MTRNKRRTSEEFVPQIQDLQKKGQLRSVWQRFRKNRVAMLGLIILTFIILVAVFADVIADYDINVTGMEMSIRNQGPSAAHWFGTDRYGRDILARIVHGARISLSMSVCIILVSFTLGGIIGSIAGYFGGRTDNILMRIMDVFYAIPYNLFAICIVAALGSGMINLVAAMTIALVPTFSRVVRSAVMPIRGQDYIESALACGTSHGRIILKHVIPNAIGPIIVHATLNVADTIKAIAGLSFIGLGIESPIPEWGAMLSEGRSQMQDFPHLVIVPGLAIMITAMSFNLIGDGLRDALDPRLKN